MRYKIYYKRWADGSNKPVICGKQDNFSVVDFSILRKDAGRSFNPESKVEEVREEILRDTGGVNVNYKSAHVGNTLVTWHFNKSMATEGEFAL